MDYSFIICRGDFMSEKLAIVVAFLMLATIGMSAANIPNLVGNWTASSEGYKEGEGLSIVNKTGALTLIVSEQTGRLITGNYSLNISLPDGASQQMTEGFSGIIGLDNKTLYISEYDKGYSFGTILSDDLIELAHLEDGESAIASIITCQKEK